jgi:3-deoxy-D-manno-octulosonic-acid transferase
VQIKFNLRFRWYITVAKKMSSFVNSDQRLTMTSVRAFLQHQSCFWFHAASVGELESLTPVIDQAYQEGYSFIVTAFSPSAKKPLQALQERFLPTRCLCGLSPLEGFWNQVLSHKIYGFMTVHYEAWPELWGVLSYYKIPLFIIAAQQRFSFRLTKRILQGLGVSLPKIIFFVAHQDHVVSLKAFASAVSVLIVYDTRYHQVQKRLLQPRSRALSLLEQLQSLQKPIGILGNLWKSDLSVINLKEKYGSWIMVPHVVDASLLNMIEESNPHCVRSSKITHDIKQTPCILVDEYGVLTELYQIADWAYVGGGFYKGVHSIIEPAVHGIPIACGPKKIKKFSDYQRVTENGQLHIIQSKNDFIQWLHNKPMTKFNVPQELFCATDKIWESCKQNMIGLY